MLKKIIIKLENNGFTLVETLIAMAIFSFMAIIIAESFASTVFYTSNLETEIKMQNEVQSSLEFVKREIRAAAYTSFNEGSTSANNSCDYLGSKLRTATRLSSSGGSPIQCTSLSSFGLYNASGSNIGNISLSPTSGILRYTNSGSISVQLNSSGVDIKNVSFFYDNYNFSGASSTSSKNYILPYISIIIEGCQTNFQNYLFNSSANSTPACVELITTATNENFIYN
jgi:prepilin-type N-terminal cleavage/methylation domain-containing protein